MLRPNFKLHGIVLATSTLAMACGGDDGGTSGTGTTVPTGVTATDSAGDDSTSGPTTDPTGGDTTSATTATTASTTTASTSGGTLPTTASASDTTGTPEPYECPNGVVDATTLPWMVTDNTDNGFAMMSGVCLDQPSAGPELVYTFTPPADDFYTFVTTSTNMFADTVLYLIEAETCDETMQIACGDETEVMVTSTTNIAKYLKQDQVVQVVVDGKVFQGTDFTLTVDRQDATCIDEVITETTLPIVKNGDTTGQPNRLTGTCFGEASDYIYEWTVPADATYQFDTLGSTPGHEDPVLYILDGNDCAGAELACNDDITLGMDRDAKLEVDLTMGQVVTIVVDGWSGAIAGPFVLNISVV